MRRLRRVEESRASSGMSPPIVGELSRRFEGAVAFIFKGGVIVDLLTIVKTGHKLKGIMVMGKTFRTWLTKSYSKTLNIFNYVSHKKTKKISIYICNRNKAYSGEC